MALPEPWSYPSNEQDDRYSLLRNYLDFTYVRLEYEGKIFYSGNQKFAVLNTGLVDRRYEPIYAIFIKNPNEGRQEWKLQDFCILGENYFGKMLVREFSEYPEAAYYFNDPRDAFYDIRRGQPKVDWEHVILENPERIPSGLIERVLPNFKAQLNRNSNSNSQEYYGKAGENAKIGQIRDLKVRSHCEILQESARTPPIREGRSVSTEDTEELPSHDRKACAWPR
jgi:hypothetical protein